MGSAITKSSEIAVAAGSPVGGGGGGVGGGGGGKGKGGGTVYRIGNQKFTLDGKEGKTLDDIIEVLHQH
jgi:hypothetical protein